MNTKWVVWVFTILGSGAFAVEFPLEPVQMTEDQAMLGVGGYGTFAQLRTQKIPAIQKEPKAVSQRPLYGAVAEMSAGNAGMAFRLDESAGTGKGYDRLILDANGNGDLSDDPVAKAGAKERESSGNYESARFGPVEIGKKQGSWQPAVLAHVYVFDRRMIESTGQSTAYVGQLRLIACCYLEATIAVDGVKQKIALHDGNCNLKLGERATVLRMATPEGPMVRVQGGDSVLRDANGSGRFESDPAQTEWEPFTGLLYMGANPYKVALADDLKTISLEPYAEATGEIAADKGKTLGRVVLAQAAAGAAPGQTSAQAKRAGVGDILVCDLGGGNVKAPVGEYSLYTCAVSGKDAKGAVVTAVGTSAGSKQTLKVEAGKTATLACGAPIELRAETELRSGGAGGFLGALLAGGERTVNINAKMVGAGGETYSTFAKSSKAGQESLSPPKFKVQTLDGKELASGQLEYG